MYVVIGLHSRHLFCARVLRPVVSAVPLCPQTNFIVPLCPHVYIYTYVGTIFNSLYVSW